MEALDLEFERVVLVRNVLIDLVVLVRNVLIDLGVSRDRTKVMIMAQPAYILAEESGKISVLKK